MFATARNYDLGSKPPYRAVCQRKTLIILKRSGSPGTAKTSTPAGGIRGAARKAAETDLICVCEDWPCRMLRSRVTSGPVCTA